MSDVTYKIRVNRPCRLFIDDEEVMILEESKLVKINLPEGEYLRKVVDLDNNAIYDETAIVLSGSSKLDIVELDTKDTLEVERNTLIVPIFKVGDLYFKPSKDRLSVEVTHNENDKYMFENINIPKHIDYSGYLCPVVSVGKRAFSGCSSLTSITFPDSIKEIDSDAFRDCSSLTSITIPNRVKSIEKSAFLGCSSLESIIIPYGMKSIERDAFRDCKSLTSIVIPDSVNNIGMGAFCGCSSLTSVIIRNSLISIGDEAFKDTAIYNNPSNWENGALYINDCLIALNEDYVGDYAIKSNTRMIGSGACWGCKELTSITIPNSVKRVGKLAFNGCFSLASITIPNSVKELDGGAFSGCSSLTSITIPKSVTKIGKRTFNACTSLNSITIPNGVSNIGKCPFMGCSSLISIDFAGTQEQWNKIEKHESWLNDSNIQFIRCIDGEITLKRELTVSVAKKTKNTKRKAILDKLFKVGDLYFSPSKDRLSVEVTRNEDDKYIFENVIIPEFVDYMGAKYLVTSIGGDAFCDCFSLTSISIPDSVKDIGYGAFWGCRSLTSITLPEHIRMIGSVFLGCISLTSIIIPNGVTNIGKRAFFRCSSLSSVTLPNSVTSIGKRAFYGCSSLTSITIPSSVKSIGKRAFKDCLSLNSINYAGTQEQWMKIEKDDNWMSGSEIKVIHCEDGEIIE